MCEELGAAYGVLPQVVFQLPWVHVRELWQSYSKRQRREMKYQAMLHSMSGMNAMTGMATGAVSPASETLTSASQPVGDRLAKLGLVR